MGIQGPFYKIVRSSNQLFIEKHNDIFLKAPNFFSHFLARETAISIYLPFVELIISYARMWIDRRALHHNEKNKIKE